MRTRYAAKLDTMSKAVTAGIFVLFAGIIGGIWLFPESDSYKSQIFTTVWLVLFPMLAYFLAPSGFSVAADAIRIHRVWSDVDIPFDTIQTVRKLEKVSNKGLIRTFGNGGFFGYYGDFRNRELGEMEWYLTRRSDILLIETDTSKILISPDDADGFMNELQSKAHLSLTK